MAKRRAFTEEDLEAIGMIEVEPGVYQKLHTPQPRKEKTKTKLIETFDNVQPQFVSFDQINKIGGTDPIEYKNPYWYVFDIIPMGKPRMNKSDFFPGKKQRSIAIRYFAWCDKLRQLASKQDYVITERMNIVFYLLISNARKKKGIKDGDPCKDKPDYDNMLKAFNDALTSKRYAKRTTIGDQHIWDVRVRKYYSNNPRIEVESLPD